MKKKTWVGEDSRYFRLKVLKFNNSLSFGILVYSQRGLVQTSKKLKTQKKVEAQPPTPQVTSSSPQVTSLSLQAISPQVAPPSLDIQIHEWKDIILKECHRNFLRFRKPSTDRIREMILTTIPAIKDTNTHPGIAVYDTAKKAFQNMRMDFMRATKDLAVEHKEYASP